MRIFIFLFGAIVMAYSGSVEKPFRPQLDKLSPFERAVVDEKATERPFTGALLHNKAEGVYTCKVCGTPLFPSSAKFDSHSGWPSFDEALPGAVREVPDADGRRVEIVCAKCGAHLGHVFRGEGMTPKNTRHCVNSASLNFTPAEKTSSQPDANASLAKAWFAGGCFWGVEYYLQQLDGVKSVVSGYMGGHVENPTYHQVVRGDTGHLETVEVLYDPAKISYEELAKHFFEIHDPEQTDGQGPDIGNQYLSAVFVANEAEAATVRKLIDQLTANGYRVATQVLPARTFYPAEEYHQDYYERKGTLPYCHRPVDRFNRKK